MRRSILAVFAALVLMISVADVVLACQPRDHGPEYNLPNTELVFLGKVLERTPVQRALGEDESCKVFRYRFQVIRAWKGVYAQEITVDAIAGCEGPKHWCDPNDWGEFMVGRSYLVYADRIYEGDENFYAWVGVAGASKPAEEATEEMQVLTTLAQNVYVPGMPGTGTPAVMWSILALVGASLCASGAILRSMALRSQAVINRSDEPGVAEA